MKLFKQTFMKLYNVQTIYCDQTFLRIEGNKDIRLMVIKKHSQEGRFYPHACIYPWNPE